MANSKRRAVCTIVCANYLPHAMTLYQSVARVDPEAHFFIMLIDCDGRCRPPARERLTFLVPDDLGLQNFRTLAFIYSILELCTNIKPTLLRYLLDTTGAEKVIYFDPDIRVYSSISVLFSMLDEHSIVLIPHATVPIDNDLRPSELDLLRSGAYNLGFIGLSASDETSRMLDWWEDRCQTNGFREHSYGMFVDQKWADLFGSYYDSVYINKHIGCDVAYWNLHYRHLSKRNQHWYVNGNVPLIFFHFSGIHPEDIESISKYQNRYTLSSRPDLVEIFAEYRDQLVANGYTEGHPYRYRYDYFDNGQGIPDIARKMLYLQQGWFAQGDSFSSKGPFYVWLKRNGMVGSAKTKERYNVMNYNPRDVRLRMMHRCFRLLLRFLGIDRYSMLMKYLAYISIPRNQGEIFIKR